jgi:hypothetical protein
MAKTAKHIKSRPEDNFEAVAKSLGCDDDKERFEATLGKIARAKPSAKMLAKRRKK